MEKSCVWLSLALCLACQSASPVGVDGGVEGGSDGAYTGPTIYRDMTDPTKWQLMDLTAADLESVGFSGGTFDGKFLYLAPRHNGLASLSPNGNVTRFDVSASFTDVSAYSSYNTLNQSPHAAGYGGAVFDGRYIYFPVEEPSGVISGCPSFVDRYDTLATFGDATAWTLFDTQQVAGGAAGAFGGSFDGRYVYFAPDAENCIFPSTPVVRYDTTVDFAKTASWSAYDVATVLGTSTAVFRGSVFDGRFVYFIPYAHTNPFAWDGSTVVRYDTQGGFKLAASWAVFDVGSMGKGFEGGAFDGRYLYLVPRDHVIVRYDTTVDFATSSSWSSFDPGAKYGFAGGTFDGRYVYFAGIVATRYDTLGDFATATSWSSFDTTTLGKTDAFDGVVFDGRYVTFVPWGYYLGMNVASGVAVRFDAKIPSEMPALPQFHGSFL
jgi:hypothetical protein